MKVNKITKSKKQTHNLILTFELFPNNFPFLCNKNPHNLVRILININSDERAYPSYIYSKTMDKQEYEFNGFIINNNNNS